MAADIGKYLQYEYVQADGDKVKDFWEVLRWSMEKVLYLGLVKKFRSDLEVSVSGKAATSYGGPTTLEFNIGREFIDPNSKPKLQYTPYPRQPVYAKYHREAHEAAAEGNYAMTEYASIANKPIIGNHYSKDLTECYISLIAHELAHLIDLQPGEKTKFPCRRKRFHDKPWQDIYKEVKMSLMYEYKRN